MVRILRKPPWLKVTAFSGEGYERVNRMLSDLHLNTVCQAANCPNRGECFNRGTATFLIMGPDCTRNCRFCNIHSGRPGPLDPEEPARLASMAARLELKHVVVTSVTRDDLPDGGAEHFAETIRQLRSELLKATVEVLTPDFRGDRDAIDVVLAARPDVFNHNVETVPRLYSEVRPGADYRRSLELLGQVSGTEGVVSKSGLMVGLGETPEELTRVFEDLAAAGVEVLTVGQYLAPSKDHHPIDRFYHPDEFDSLGEAARACGLRRVFAAPLVRSSYRAEEQLP